ncbi:hypothetical protein [Halosimplex sp. J119]
MSGGETRKRIEDIISKLESGVRLATDDVIFIFGHVPSLSDYGELEQYRNEIDYAIPSGVGHGAYVEILRRLEKVGVIDELRPDLVDPSLHPDGFERIEGNGEIRYRGVTVGEGASEGVGRIHPPDKRPTSLWRLKMSVLEYLFCIEKGFRFDPEMIYDFETDYREFLRAVISCTALNEYQLAVTAEGNTPHLTVRVSLSVGGRSYTTAFEPVSDWIRFDALEPVQEALDEQTSQTVHHHSAANDGWILILADEHEELVVQLPDD